MKHILIVVDMQNDFIDGALGSKEAVAIVDSVKEKIRSYPSGDIMATMDTHGGNYLETQEGRMLPVVHCIRGTEGWKIRPDIEELLKGAKIYEKPTFGSMKMAEDLKLLIRFYAEDWTHKELARELGISPANCRKRIQRAKEKLRRLLEENDRSKKK